MTLKNVYRLDPDFSYSLKELRHVTRMSEELLTEIFEEEPGVVIFQRHNPGRRRYRSFRIPGWVAINVFDRMTVAEA